VPKKSGLVGIDTLYRRPGHLFRRCHQISTGMFLERCKGFKIRPLQYAVLEALHEQGPAQQIALSGMLALDRTTIGLTVDKLEARGLVKRVDDPADRRINVVMITDAGLKLLGQIEPIVARMQEELLAPLSKADREQLIDILNRLAEEHNEASRAPLRRQSES